MRDCLRISHNPRAQVVSRTIFKMAVGVWCIVKCNTGVLRHLGFELGRGMGINEKATRGVELG